MTNVPLANIQDEWCEFVDFKTRKEDNFKDTLNILKETTSNKEDKNEQSKLIKESIQNLNNLNNQLNDQIDDEIEEELSAFEQQFEQFKKEEDRNLKIKVESLEELVNTFDAKIVNCFFNYEEPVVMPVQILNQEELINDCP